MDGTRMQSLVNKGFRISAAKVGLPFSVYRPTGPADPIGPATMLTVLPAAFSADDYRFRRPQGYAKPLWTALVDGGTTQPGDYLVEVAALPGQGIRTFFIAAQQQLLPIIAIECNAVLSFSRPGPAATEGSGADGYGDASPPMSLITGWPASLVAGTKGEKSDDGLPRDTRQPWYSVLLPPSQTVELQTDDQVTDQDGLRYLVSSAELTPLGWRLTVMYSGT